MQVIDRGPGRGGQIIVSIPRGDVDRVQSQIDYLTDIRGEPMSKLLLLELDAFARRLGWKEPVDLAVEV